MAVFYVFKFCKWKQIAQSIIYKQTAVDPDRIFGVKDS